MEEEQRKLRILAVERFQNGESPESICISIGKSRTWLYKWVRRYIDNYDSWNEDHSRRPHSSSKCTSAEIEEIVKMVRLKLYNQDLFYGAQAIHWEMEDLGGLPCAVHPHH